MMATQLRISEPLPALAMGVDDKSFRGSYLLYRKAGGGLSRVGGKVDRGGAAPRFRHPDRASAVAEAARLLAIFPQSTFIILQEVGRVKLKEVVSG